MIVENREVRKCQSVIATPFYSCLWVLASMYPIVTYLHTIPLLLGASAANKELVQTISASTPNT